MISLYLGINCSEKAEKLLAICCLLEHESIYGISSCLAADTQGDLRSIAEQLATLPRQLVTKLSKNLLAMGGSSSNEPAND